MPRKPSAANHFVFINDPPTRSNTLVLPHVRALLTIAVLLTLGVMTSDAARIDLRLDVDYTDASPTAGGTWSLYAETDEQGLFSLNVPLTGVNAGIARELPFGRVNGSTFPNAGFATFTTRAIQGAQQITTGQVVAPQGGGSQQGVFYGVGTLANGSPNFPGRPGGTAAVGPSITSLTNLQNSPWANDDPFSNTGVTVASGSFAAGQMPRFGTSGTLAGSLLTSIGTIGTPGDRTLDVDFSTLVSTNLDFGVATGDYNNDGVVDAADYTVWRDSVGSTVPLLTGADGNGDGQINSADRIVWATNYGTSSSSTATAVPEAQSLWLLATIQLATLSLGRPRRRTADSCI